jgi:hypothetical protein
VPRDEKSCTKVRVWLAISRADSDAVEFLVGHSLGLRGIYTDPDALQLREAVALIPPLGDAGNVVTLRNLLASE